MNIKIFGERNTATIALLSMLRVNSKSFFYPGSIPEHFPNLVERNIFYRTIESSSVEKKEKLIDDFFLDKSPLYWWKHSCTNFDINDTYKGIHFIFTVRNPKSWLISLFKNPYHILVPKPKNLIDFSKMNWKILKRENLNDNFYTPIKLYEEKLKSYINLIKQLEKNNLSYSIVKFEDFVNNQNVIFNNLRQFLKLPNKSFVEFTTSTKDERKNSSYYRNYYKNDNWIIDFPEIKNILVSDEKEVFSYFGYDCL